MHRIDGLYHDSNMFTEGEPGVTPATQTTDDWLNDVQETLLDPVVTAGLTPTKGLFTQLTTAIQTLAAALITALKAATNTWAGGNTFNGSVSFTGTVGSTQKVTAPNTCKASARITCNGSGTATVVNGFNVASATITSNELAVTFTNNMPTANYAVQITKIAAPSVEVNYMPVESITGKSAAGFRIQGLNGTSPVSMDNGQIRVNISIFDPG